MHFRSITFITADETQRREKREEKGNPFNCTLDLVKESSSFGLALTSLGSYIFNCGHVVLEVPGGQTSRHPSGNLEYRIQ